VVVPSGMVDVEDIRKRGNERFKLEDWDGAIEAYNEALSFGSERVGATRLLSNRALARIHKAKKCGVDGKEDDDGADAQESRRMRRMLLEEALEDACEVIRLDPSWPRGWYRKGTVLMELGRLEDAREAYRQGLDHCGELGENDQGVRDLSLSWEALNKRIGEVDSSDHEGEKLRVEGNDAFHKGDWDTAIGLYTQAINAIEAAERAPDKRIFSNRSAAYLKKAQEQESSFSIQYAIEDADRCLSIDSLWSKAWYRKGTALMAAGRREEAKKVFLDGLAHCPNDTDLLRGLTEVESAPKQKLSPKDLEIEPSDKAKVELPTKRTVKDPELYNVLGVPTDAADGIIKKAYYNLAKECHPDKHPDDPLATEKFQKIGEAYQVLSNPQTRELYDLHGRDGLDQSAFEAMDPSQLFAMLFGSDRFVRYFGELEMTTQMSRVDDEGNAPSEEALKEIQRERESKLLQTLIGLIQPWVDGEKQAFEEWARCEAASLKDEHFGDTYLYTVGFVYHRKSVIELGRSRLFGVPAFVNGVKYSGSKFGNQAKLVISAAKVMNQQKKMESVKEEGKFLSEEDATKMAMGFAQEALSLMFSMSVYDIQNTLDRVCDRFLRGEGLPDDKQVERKVSPQEKDGGLLDTLSSIFTMKGRKEHEEGERAVTYEDLLHRRATGLKKLGRIFMETGKEQHGKIFPDEFMSESASHSNVKMHKEEPSE